MVKATANRDEGSRSACKVQRVLVQRDQADAALGNGMTQVAVAARWGYSQSSVARHAANHLGNGIGFLGIERARADLGNADLLEILCSALDDANAIRASAIHAGRSSLALQATGSARELVKLIREMMGSTENPTDIVAEMRDLVRLMDAVAVAVRAEPIAGRAIADALESAGDEETADALRKLADSSQKSLDMKWQGR